MDIEAGSIARKEAQCRICHDEDEESNMEVPCSCCGSLKYAHRQCVQRWCNEKGDTSCEICLQQFKPGYTAPSPILQLGGIPMTLRGEWEIPQRDLYNFQFISMAPADHNFTDPHFHEYSTSYSRSLMWCRLIAIIFVFLVVLRLSLPVIIYSSEQYSLASFPVPILKIVGVLMPMYFIIMCYTASQRHHYYRQESGNSRLAISSRENDFQLRPPQLHMMI